VCGEVVVTVQAAAWLPCCLHATASTPCHAILLTQTQHNQHTYNFHMAWDSIILPCQNMTLVKNAYFLLEVFFF
jgi:hypothetical protein